LELICRDRLDAGPSGSSRVPFVTPERKDLKDARSNKELSVGEAAFKRLKTVTHRAGWLGPE
jgi:hypothetical protein